MAGKGETVKYVIDADTSGFSRGMATAAIESEVAGKKIDRSLSSTNKSAENNFKDIRRNAQISASSIRNFGVAFQGFNATSMIIGVTALSGVVLELAGAFVAAGSTGSLLLPVLAQGFAASKALKSGLFGLADAFKAIGNNDPRAFAESMVNLGPAARQVAYGVAGLNKAFNSIRLNTQQALLAGVGTELLRLGALILPTVNAGFQLIGRSMNGAFNQAASLASQPIFSGLLATIFADTAHNITILSGALAPLLSMFTNLYLITRPYVSLLAQSFVNMLKNGAAFLSTTRGQESLNIAIQQGILALIELRRLAGAVFGFLTAIFHTAANSGISLISTITGMIHSMTDWINTAKGQAQLIALFQFTSLAVKAVGNAFGIALQAVFSVVQGINSLNPAIQLLIVNFLASALTIRPLLSYLSLLYQSLKILVLTLFNVGEQAIVVFGALGGLASVVLLIAAGFIILGAVIKGPLGAAFLVVGAIMLAYIGLSYLLERTAQAGATAFVEESLAAMELAGVELDLAAIQGVLAGTMSVAAGASFAAGTGLSFAARAAIFLQAALIPLLVLAAGIAVILGMLGAFSGKGQQAQSVSTGLGGSLGALQKSMQGVGATGGNATKGLAPLSDSLKNVGNAANAAQGQLASFDKMNVLTPTLGTSIPNAPSLPDLGGLGGAPLLDTGAFDKSLADMQKNFEGLKMDLAGGVFNPFDTIGKWIDAHPWIALAGFVAILAAIAIGFLFMNAAALPMTLVLGLIVLAVIAFIAIIILLVMNWTTVWKTIQSVASAAWDGIKATWEVVVAFFTAIFSAIGTVVMFYINIYVTAFKLAWAAIQIIWSVAVSWFGAVWNGIMGVFAGAGGWFGSVFNGAWNAIKNAFGAVGGFFQGVWNSIVNIFGAVGTAIGNAIGGAFKSVVNTIINTVSGIVNNVIDLINGAIDLINHIPGVHIGAIGHLVLPRLAKGGIVTQSTIANIGENGAEAVMPLENNTAWIDQLASKINSSNGGGDGQPIQLTVQIGEDKVATKIINLINEKTQMGGRNTILI